MVKKDKDNIQITMAHQNNLNLKENSYGFITLHFSNEEIKSENFEWARKTINEIEKAKAYDMRIIPTFEIGSLENYHYYRKYIVKLIHMFPEFLYYTKSSKGSNDMAVICEEPYFTIVCGSTSLYNTYVKKQPEIPFTKTPEKVIKWIDDYLQRIIGHTKEDAEKIIEEIIT